VRDETPASVTTEHAPLSIVVADFENRTGEAVFDGALEHAIAIGLETASFVSIVPRQDALVSAASIGGRLDTSSARLVAQRDGIGAVVTGVVSTTPSGYVVTTQILDPVPGTAIASARQTAATKEEVLGAMAAIARELRRGLGDHELSSTTDFAQETFTTSSLDAAREYVLAQDASSAGRDEQAVQHYNAAIRHDPQFGRAYAGLALMSLRVGQLKEAKEYLAQALSLRDRMTERERLRTEGLNAISFEEDYTQAREIYQRLLAKYPSDHAALNNLAVAEFQLLQLGDASATGRRVAQLHPNARHYVNLALYAMYAGDMATATGQAREALKLSPQSSLAYLPLAVNSILAGRLAQARQDYAQMSVTGARGAALSTIGLADLSAMQGHYLEAQHDIAAGLASGGRNISLATSLRLLRAELALQSDNRALARNEARTVIEVDTTSTAMFRAAEVLALSGDAVEAPAYADRLGAKPNAITNWYRRILLARLGATRGDFAPLEELEAAFAKEPPMWIAHYSAGVMQFAGGRAKEALSHLTWCVEHPAAASAAYLNDVPTLRYVPQARYWRARVLESVSPADARRAYEEVLRQRRGGPDDSLAREVRDRLGRLNATR
jgi:tetratricopeptide (TPR) repeat protein